MSVLQGLYQLSMSQERILTIIKLALALMLFIIMPDITPQHSTAQHMTHKLRWHATLDMEAKG
ncbi:hypothetical protein QR509_26565, partial [Escherichia coli]|uniref:hypothetical protein n=1 Tax=Escherichia coli TaxID=562 RepID=UPI0027387ADF